ncbi:MAG TPA: cob(I)yrinic acid a,c-diamide adenosyltransferase [Fimbriimonadaceae bacterium]|nr:cob(I)yrinic acid a,c-diamide adenosyltransferase [Fimbriimonadaceae bacterium]
MRIYTRTGDDGSTGLVGDARIQKSDLRIAAIGEVDELNAAIGLARHAASGYELENELAQIQNQLFDVGAELASPDGQRYQVRNLEARHVEQLERSIDAMDSELSRLKNFILPGGGELAGRLHLARSICRRAERTTYALSEKASIRDVILIYLNRLSDWLFTAARTANRLEGVEDIIWTSEGT